MQVPPTSTPATSPSSNARGGPHEAVQADAQFDLVLNKEMSNDRITAKSPQGNGSSLPPEGKPDADLPAPRSTHDRSSALQLDTSAVVPAEPERRVLQAPSDLLKSELSVLLRSSATEREQEDEELSPLAAQDSLSSTSAAAALLFAPAESALERPVVAAFDAEHMIDAGNVSAELPARRSRVVSDTKELAGQTSASRTRSEVLAEAPNLDRRETESVKVETSSGSSPPVELRTHAAERSVTTHADALREGQPLLAPAPQTALPAVEATRLPSASFESIEIASAREAEKLHPRVGTGAWETALGQKISWMIGDQQQTASLTLEPPDLGILHVVVTVSQDQATAAFVAAEPEVRKALEAAIPRLREMMDAAGIQLGDATVSAGTSGNENAPPRARYLPPNEPSDSQIRVPSVPDDPTQKRLLSWGLVDTFA